MELQVDLHEGGRRGGSCYHHTGTFSQSKDILKAKAASLADETFEMRLMRGNKHHGPNDFFVKFFKSLINAFISFFGVNRCY
jgi:hypothetical protein